MGVTKIGYLSHQLTVYTVESSCRQKHILAVFWVCLSHPLLKVPFFQISGRS